MAARASEIAAAAFDPLRPRLTRIAYRTLGSVADAEDVVQDAFLARHRWRGDPRPGSLSAPPAAARIAEARLLHAFGFEGVSFVHQPLALKLEIARLFVHHECPHVEECTQALETNVATLTF